MRINKNTTMSLAAFVGLMFTAGSLHSATIQVDIGAGVGGRADKEPLPQSGWEEWQTPDFTSTGSFSTTFAFADTTGGTLGASLATTTGAGARNYGLDGVSDPGNLAVPNVWADLFFFNNNTSGSLTLTLNNLNAGIYEITTYHYADQLSAAVGPNDAGIADILVNGTDTGLDATLLVGFDGGEPKTAAELVAGQRTFQFTVANDDDPVGILFDGLDTNGGGDTFGLNGFELSVIPEPSSAALLVGFGGLALLRRRRN